MLKIVLSYEYCSFLLNIYILIIMYNNTNIKMFYFILYRQTKGAKSKAKTCEENRLIEQIKT